MFNKIKEVVNQNDRGALQEMLRILVRLTKSGIRDRILMNKRNH